MKKKMYSTSCCVSINSHAPVALLTFLLKWSAPKLNWLPHLFFSCERMKGLPTLSTSQSTVFFWYRTIFLCRKELDLILKVSEQQAGGDGEVRTLPFWSSIQSAWEQGFHHCMKEELGGNLHSTSLLFAYVSAPLLEPDQGKNLDSAT